MNTEELQQAIERFAPSALQESWDNTGWNVNLHNENIRGIMVCLDATPEAVEAAARANCQVVVSHHPLLFKAVKDIDSRRMPGRSLAALIAAGISLYCAHTSADSTQGGINTWLGQELGLRSLRPLEPQAVKLFKLAVTVPAGDAEKVRQALSAAGAGSLGEYTDCTFSVAGTGRFRPAAGARPTIGQAGVLETVSEIRIEALVAEPLVAGAVAAVGRAHPYEMPAIDVYPLRNTDCGKSGLGAVGDLPEPMPLSRFAELVKRKLETGPLAVSGDPGTSVRRVGLCGGAGSSLIADAEREGCDVFLTGELHHNDFCDHDIALIAAGHYDTEKCFLKIMQNALQMCEPVIQYKVDVRVFTDGRPYIDC